jgi:uncharacterized protein YecE (DUF72 family)
VRTTRECLLRKRSRTLSKSGVVYGGRYGRKSLQSWADRIRGWLAEGRIVYAYFNDDAFGYAIEDAQALRDLLGVHE